MNSAAGFDYGSVLRSYRNFGCGSSIIPTRRSPSHLPDLLETEVSTWIRLHGDINVGLSSLVSAVRPDHVAMKKSRQYPPPARARPAMRICQPLPKARFSDLDKRTKAPDRWRTDDAASPHLASSIADAPSKNRSTGGEIYSRRQRTIRHAQSRLKKFS